MPNPKTERRMLEVAIAWGEDAFLCVEHRALERGFVVGADDDADFRIDASQLGRATWPLVTPSPTGPRVSVPEGAQFAISVGSDLEAIEGACDGAIERRLVDGETITIRHAGMRFRIRTTAALTPPARDLSSLVPGSAMALFAAGLVTCLTFLVRPPETLRIVAETTIDLSHPVVAALVAERRNRPPVRRIEPRVVPAISPRVIDDAPDGRIVPERPNAPERAVPDTEHEGDTGARDRSTRDATREASSAVAETAETNEPTIDFGSEVAAAREPPAELGAIRSGVRALSRCFDERRAVAEEGTAAARARLDECLANAPTVRPDAIVSFDIEVRDSRGNVERAEGGRFGIAVAP